MRIVVLDECDKCPDSGGGGGQRRRTVATTLAEVPLDPARLRHLPPPRVTAMEDDSDNSNSDNSNSGGGIGNRRGDDCNNGAMVAPHSIPPNAILVC